MISQFENPSRYNGIEELHQSIITLQSDINAGKDPLIITEHAQYILKKFDSFWLIDALKNNFKKLIAKLNSKGDIEGVKQKVNFIVLQTLAIKEFSTNYCITFVSATRNTIVKYLLHIDTVEKQFVKRDIKELKVILATLVEPYQTLSTHRLRTIQNDFKSEDERNKSEEQALLNKKFYTHLYQNEFREAEQCALKIEDKEKYLFRLYLRMGELKKAEKLVRTLENPTYYIYKFLNKKFFRASFRLMQQLGHVEPLEKSNPVETADELYQLTQLLNSSWNKKTPFEDVHKYLDQITHFDLVYDFPIFIQTIEKWKLKIADSNHDPKELRVIQKEAKSIFEEICEFSKPVRNYAYTRMRKLTNKELDNLSLTSNGKLLFENNLFSPFEIAVFTNGYGRILSGIKKGENLDAVRKLLVGDEIYLPLLFLIPLAFSEINHFTVRLLLQHGAQANFYETQTSANLSMILRLIYLVKDEVEPSFLQTLIEGGLNPHQLACRNGKRTSLLNFLLYYFPNHPFVNILIFNGVRPTYTDRSGKFLWKVKIIQEDDRPSMAEIREQNIDRKFEINKYLKKRIDSLIQIYQKQVGLYQKGFKNIFSTSALSIALPTVLNDIIFGYAKSESGIGITLQCFQNLPTKEIHYSEEKKSN